MNLPTSPARARRREVWPTLVAVAVTTVIGLGTAACGSTSMSDTTVPAAAAVGSVGPAGSDGSAASGGPVGSPAAAPADDSAATTPAGDGAARQRDICRLLPVATVAAVTGKPLTEAAEDDTPSIQLYQCSYTDADGTAGVTVDAIADGAAPGYAATLSAEGDGAKLLPGLGDKAFSGITGVHALFGDILIDVADLNSDSAAESLIRTLQPQL